VDGDLLAAVAVRAAERGETVTDVIIQRFEAYIRDAETVAPPVSEPPVYTPREAPASYEAPPCKHPAGSVEAGECRECGADVF
jgi:hypothetical protein